MSDQPSRSREGNHNPPESAMRMPCEYGMENPCHREVMIFTSIRGPHSKLEMQFIENTSLRPNPLQSNAGMLHVRLAPSARAAPQRKQVRRCP
jgi:hypothetical protein